MAPSKLQPGQILLQDKELIALINRVAALAFRKAETVPKITEAEIKEFQKAAVTLELSHLRPATYCRRNAVRRSHTKSNLELENG